MAGTWDATAPVVAHSGVALNRQIARHLAARIDAGELIPGAALPSEAALAVFYGVNRLTVRHALGDLARQGLVMTARGRRATVAFAPVRYRLDQAAGTSLSSALVEQDLAVAYEVVAITPTDASDRPLPLDPAGRCVRIDYRRLVDGQPWSLSTTWVPALIAPTTWRGEAPLLDDIAAVHGLKIRRALRCFAAVPASLDAADALDVAVGTALLRVTGTSVDQHDTTVAVVRHHVLGDRAEYVVNLTT